MLWIATFIRWLCVNLIPDSSINIVSCFMMIAFCSERIFEWDSYGIYTSGHVLKHKTHTHTHGKHFMKWQTFTHHGTHTHTCSCKTLQNTYIWKIRRLSWWKQVFFFCFIKSSNSSVKLPVYRTHQAEHSMYEKRFSKQKNCIADFSWHRHWNEFNSNISVIKLRIFIKNIPHPNGSCEREKKVSVWNSIARGIIILTGKINDKNIKGTWKLSDDMLQQQRSPNCIWFQHTYFSEAN